MLQRGTALAVIVALSLALVVCGGSGEDDTGGETAATPAPAQAAPTPTPQAAPTPAEETASTSGDADLVEHIRERAMHLWDVYNTYDMDGLKALYEASYWEEREAQTRSEMQPFQSNAMTFTAEETSPPTEIAPGQWEVKHRASFPGGSINMVFVYEQFDGEWLLTHAEPE